MQLKIQRSQRAGGVVGNTIFFCLDVRADYSAEEKSNILRYKLGNQVIYNSQAAKKHLENASAHLQRTQTYNLREQAAGLTKGMVSLAMSKIHLSISIASLGRGHHVECKDLEELLEAEETVRTACKGVTRFLKVAETFDGSEVVIDYVDGEERTHISQNAPPLLEYSPSNPGVSASLVTDANAAPEFGEKLKEFWANPGYRKLVYWGGGILLMILMLRSCFG